MFQGFFTSRILFHEHVISILVMAKMAMKSHILPWIASMFQLNIIYQVSKNQATYQ